MRLISAAFFLLLALAATPVQALECVLINKPVFGTVTTVPTQNGTMWVVYPINVKLPIRTFKLTDGTRVTGGLPGKIPLGFFWADKDSKVRAVRNMVLQYVPQADAQPGKVSYSNPQGQLVFFDSISPVPAYQVDTYFSPPLLSPITKIEITFPKALMLQYCVEPGDSVGIGARQLLRQRR